MLHELFSLAHNSCFTTIFRGFSVAVYFESQPDVSIATDADIGTEVSNDFTVSVAFDAAISLQIFTYLWCVVWYLEVYPMTFNLHYPKPHVRTDMCQNYS